ncbi:TraY domain-containing protein [Desulforhabdus sp. TSK]
MLKILAVELPEEINARLDRLSGRTGRSKVDYVGTYPKISGQLAIA